MPAYVIAEIEEIHDPETYARYRTIVPASITAYGGRFIVRGGTSEVLEGEWNLERLVILEFDSVEQARAWWHSPEYREARDLRQSVSKGRLLLIEGQPG